jgi:hypothetical protein
LPYIAYVLERVHPPLKAGIEHMIHSDNIGKICLVIGDEEHPSLR